MNSRLEIPPERNLADALFEHGVEFPCGGTSQCGGCRMRVLEGNVPVTPEMRQVLSDEELRQGWRLGCCASSRGKVVLEVAQWTPSILEDSSAIPVKPRRGAGVAVDLGTTTVVAQLVDLSTGEVLAVRSGLNPQCRYGADVMTRIAFERDHPGVLTSLVRTAIGSMIEELGGQPLETLICGNTVMHHLFLGCSVEPLAAYPFETECGGSVTVPADQFGWPSGGEVTFLPCLGGFVGSDVLAGIGATGMADRSRPEVLIDLGTNGEIVAGTRDSLWCASAAAGPAFEAGRIRMGMRASTGAVDRVRVRGDALDCHVIGGVPARGICGSGLVDAVAAALDTGVIVPSGRFAAGRKEWRLAGPVILYQSDIRELQLAQGAIVAGLKILSRCAGLSLEDISRIHLAGAFGNYLNIESARCTGLISRRIQQVEPAGNTALRGTRRLLLDKQNRDSRIAGLLRKIRHVPLSGDPEFQEIFTSSLAFAG